MSKAFTETSKLFLKYKKESQEPENKSDDAKKKEDWRGEKVARAGMEKDFAGSPTPEWSPHQAHSEPLHNTKEEVPGACVIQPAVKNSPEFGAQTHTGALTRSECRCLSCRLCQANICQNISLV